MRTLTGNWQLPLRFLWFSLFTSSTLLVKGGYCVQSIQFLITTLCIYMYNPFAAVLWYNSKQTVSFFFHFIKESSEELDKRRASEREGKRKPVRFQSSEDDLKTKKKKRRRLNPLLRVPRRDPSIPFKCDLCGSPYVINPTRRGNRPKLSTHQPSPRHKVDPDTGKTLTLCNACGG